MISQLSGKGENIMTDTLKNMYNSEALLEEVDVKIKAAPVTIIFTTKSGITTCNYTYNEIKKILDDNLPITDVIATDSTGVYHGGHITRLANATSLDIIFISSFTKQSEHFDTAKFFGYTYSSSGSITKYVPAS